MCSGCCTADRVSTSGAKVPTLESSHLNTKFRFVGRVWDFTTLHLDKFTSTLSILDANLVDLVQTGKVLRNIGYVTTSFIIKASEFLIKYTNCLESSSVVAKVYNDEQNWTSKGFAYAALSCYKWSLMNLPTYQGYNTLDLLKHKMGVWVLTNERVK